MTFSNISFLLIAAFCCCRLSAVKGYHANTLCTFLKKDMIVDVKNSTGNEQRLID